MYFACSLPLQNILHGCFERLHAEAFVKLLRGWIECPYVKGDVVAADFSGKRTDVLIELGADVFAAAGFIHADVIHVECLVGNQINGGKRFNNAADGITAKMTSRIAIRRFFVRTHKDTNGWVCKESFHAILRIFSGIHNKKIRTAGSVNIVHLIQKP